jgi:hypothetical protein
MSRIRRSFDFTAGDSARRDIPAWRSPRDAATPRLFSFPYVVRLGSPTPDDAMRRGARPPPCTLPDREGPANRSATHHLKPEAEHGSPS